MFSQIDFRIHDDKIEVAGQELLLGDLTVDILSISPQEFETMFALSQDLTEQRNGGSLRRQIVSPVSL